MRTVRLDGKDVEVPTTKLEANQFQADANARALLAWTFMEELQRDLNERATKPSEERDLIKEGTIWDEYVELHAEYICYEARGRKYALLAEDLPEQEQQ